MSLYGSAEENKPTRFVKQYFINKSNNIFFRTNGDPFSSSETDQAWSEWSSIGSNLDTKFDSLIS
jgi:hypothetical protein